jgi:Na+-translocating ferredoxin:NAD+ oxidoreductase RnfE subunit
LFLCQLFVAPIVVCGTSLLAGLAFSIAMTLLVLPSFFLFRVVKIKLRLVKIFASVFVPCLVFVLVMFFLKGWFPDVVGTNRIYFVLLVLHTFMLSEYSVFAKTGNAYKPFGVKNHLLYVLFFSVQMLLVSAVREWLGGGSLGGVFLPSVKAAGVLLPCGGFILFGFLLAAVNAFQPKEISRS